MQISDGMKKFLLKLGLFFALILVADIVLGAALGYLANHAKGGFTQRDAYICNRLETDFLLMGSSRCVRH